MANTTLLDVAKQRLTDAETEQQAAATALTAAQTALPVQQKQQTDAAAAAAALAADEAVLRQQLAQVLTQAAGDALLAELESLIIQARAAQAAVLVAGDAVFTAQQAVDKARQRQQAADAALAAATAAKTAAERDDGSRAAWKTMARASTVPADATSALGAAPHTTAQTKLADFVPDPLQKRALDRAKAERARVEELTTRTETAEGALGTERASNGGTTGAIEGKRVVFSQRAAELEEFATTAPERLARALSLLTVVLTAPAPSATDTTAIQTAVDEAKTGTDAFAAEEARDKAAADLEAAKTALETKQLAKLADPTVDTTTEEQAVTDSEGKLQQKETSYSQALHDKIDKAEAAVPDAAWRVVAAFEEADTILTDLKNENPTKLADDTDKAEQDLVKAIDDDAAASGTAAAIAQRARTDADAAAAAARSEPDHVFSALRGDR